MQLCLSIDDLIDQVSILIFLDSPATPCMVIFTVEDSKRQSFNPYFPGLSCNCFWNNLGRHAYKFQSLFSWTLLQHSILYHYRIPYQVSILVFLDYFATTDDLQRSWRGYWVSILVFLDYFATQRWLIYGNERDNQCFNPYFPGLSCNNGGSPYRSDYAMFQSLFSWTLLQLEMEARKQAENWAFQSLFSWTLLQQPFF